jgi:crotonobetainyl-CoA:carnitine CoA-transferase CaiB-like acyl-CoA transferase
MSAHLVGQPLHGLRVIDLSRVLAGPFGTMLLADLGAEVIKVELPGSGDPSRANEPKVAGESHYFMAVNRNKKSIAVDLTTAGGRQTILDLCAHADILIENFRPGVMQKLGLSYDDVRAVNGRIVYCSISGFGPTGPLAARPAYNEVLQAMSGLMSINGDADGPPMKLGVPIGDLAGGLFGVIGILAALRQRDLTGEGEWIDVALFDTSVGLLGYLAGLYFMTGDSPPRVGSGHHSIAPLGVYPTKDGYVALSIFTTKFWRSFCAAVGREDLSADERFTHNAARVANKRVLDEIIREVMVLEDTATWLERLREADVPHAPVQTVGDALEHPHASARELVETYTHPTAGEVRTTGRVLKFGSGRPTQPLTPAPLLGEHTLEVLSEVLGYDEDSIDRLRASGAVETASDRAEAER